MNVVITGASRGIGRSIALRFGKGGHHLAICSRNENSLQQVKSEIQKINPTTKVFAQKANISNQKEIGIFGENVLEKFESIDVLVNNAGIFLPGAIHEELEGQLEKMMVTNVYSAYHLTRSLLPRMMQQKKGHIINMCSTASLKAYPNGGSYSISKFALLGFSKNLREEMKPYHIKVTAVCPGPTWTDSWAGANIPKEKFMTTDDIAEVIWNICHLSPQADVEEIILRPISGDI
jgi:short-subunit dehydrogenase